MQTFAIYGEIMDEADGSFDSVTPSRLRSFAENNLNKGEELQLLFNSPGGSVFAGIAIANLIRNISSRGHKVTGVVQGLAASAASIILCACDEIILPESGLVMIHNAWTTMSGNSEDLRKEADTLDTIKRAMLAIYRTKFDLPEERIAELLDAETWFSGREAAEFRFACTVVPDEKDFAIAAKIKNFDMSQFRNFIMPNDDEVKNVSEENISDTNTEEQAVAVEETRDETQADETSAENAPGEVPSAETPEEMIPRCEVEKRVSGMQSTMAKKLDALRADYEAKINDFTNQLKSKEEELTTARAEVTSLKQTLDGKDQEIAELSERTSAVVNDLAEKTQALAALNGRVNTPCQADETKPWKNLKGEALVQWCREHPTAR